MPISALDHNLPRQVLQPICCQFLIRLSYKQKSSLFEQQVDGDLGCASYLSDLLFDVSLSLRRFAVKTVVLASLKGGSGKSTIVANLEASGKVAIIDMDSPQGSQEVMVEALEPYYNSNVT